MDNNQKDLHLTNSILNLLRAGFLGKVVFHSVMTQLGSKLLDDEYLRSATRTLGKIEPWIKDLYDNLPIFSISWKSPETFEAIKAMTFLDDLKSDLQWLVSQLEKALKVPNLSKEHEAIRFLVAGIARTANVRANYLDGLGAFLAKFSPDQDLNYLKQQFYEAQEYVQVTHVIFDSFKDLDAVTPELAARLHHEASLLAGDFRAHIHDIIILKNSYEGEVTFEKAGFTKDQAAIWEAQRFSAVTAGYWNAYRLTPKEAIEWSQQEIFSPSVAANWKRSGFTPETATNWNKAGFAPVLAKLWFEAGCDAEYAATMVSRGIMDPIAAKKTDIRNSDVEVTSNLDDEEEDKRSEAA